MAWRSSAPLSKQSSTTVSVELIQPLSDVDSRRRLRSASTAEVLVPATRRSTIGDRALAVAGPRAWNNLPVDVRLSETFSTFKTHLSHISVEHILPFSLTVSPTIFLYRALEAACAAYASLNLSVLHYILPWLLRTYLMCFIFSIKKHVFNDFYSVYVFFIFKNIYNILTWPITCLFVNLDSE